MERHELINKYEKRLQKENPSRIEQLYCEIIRDLTELEQTKVVVPGFVAEWIEQCKEKKNRLLTALLYTPGEVNSWVDDPDNQETFALAWMFGYTIKKEPRYFVEIKATKHRFAKYGNGRIYFSLKYESAFTQAELEKAGFGWVFDCTGIEILEVE
jgi:hypothetical protein